MKIKKKNKNNLQMNNFNLDKFKDYVNTYDNQSGHENYFKQTIDKDSIKCLYENHTLSHDNCVDMFTQYEN
jgi:hypothetical protein